MIQRVQIGTAIFLAFAFWTLHYPPAQTSAFDDTTTHREMTRQAARTASVDHYLKKTLAMGQGLESPLTGSSGIAQPILEWLQDGATLEDDPPCRASNHFHNPLKPFADAGVTDRVVEQVLACSGTPYTQRHGNARWGTGYTSPTDPGAFIGNLRDYGDGRWRLWLF